ncbi:MAG: hypothetical protein GC149_20410 [Gammaproteobacteria bacterium]|nr:hypothetical protein [Gammaproteobacteria bacterium]
MPKVTTQLKEAALVVRTKTEKHLQPADTKAILGHVIVLLRQYYVAELPPEIHEGLARQWVSVLKEFPEWAIENAITAWLIRDKRGRKPVPGQIHDLAAQQVSKSRAVIALCDRVRCASLHVEPEPEPEMTPEEREEANRRVSALVAEARRNLAMGPEVLKNRAGRTGRTDEENI